MSRVRKPLNLLALREARRWTQQETAKQVGISRSYYAMLEISAREPSVAVAKKLAKIFHLEWHIFFDQVKTG